MQYDYIRSHLEMLQDGVRTRAYLEAIREIVRPGDRVLDFGCGTGVLSIFAERAGAGRVYALDRSTMLSAAELIFAENGCTRIEPVFGDGDVVELPTEVDVIVSEWMGHFLFAERMLEPLIRLRDRFLRPGGRMIPARCSLQVALVVERSYFEELSFLGTRPYGIDFALISDLPLQDVGIMRMQPEDLLPQTACVATLDLATVTGTPRVLHGSIVSPQDATVFGVCGWFKADLSPNVTLTTSPFAEQTHWLQFHFPINRPLDIRAGVPVEIDIKVIPQREQNGYSWRVRTAGGVRYGESLERPNSPPLSPTRAPTSADPDAPRETE
jgi:type I protein arginine methyltransferase